MHSGNNRLEILIIEGKSRHYYEDIISEINYVKLWERMSS